MMEIVEILSTISLMKKQEQSYLSKDYLHNFRDQMEHQYQYKGTLDRFTPVDEDFRLCMITCCHEIARFCEFDCDIVAISTNYLDRFSSTTEGRNARKDRIIYQLAALTCLYTAIKIHEVEAIDPTFISNLSNGDYTEEQVVDMEQKIVISLRWRLNPPTPSAFTQVFLSVFPDTTMSRDEKSAVMKLARNQIELSIEKYHFLSYNASCIAFASLTNAIQKTRKGNCRHILKTLSKIADIDLNSQAFIECRENLRTVMNMTRYNQESHSIPQPLTINKNFGFKNTVHDSPRGVDTFSKHCSN